MRAKPDLSRAIDIPIPPELAAQRWVQPEGECHHCGTPASDLVPTTVAGYGSVLDMALCLECREQLAREDAVIQL